VTPVADIDDEIRLVMGPITIPAYLDRPHIVVRDEGRLHTSEFDRWSEPLADGVAMVLTQQISAAAGVEALPFMWPGGLGSAWRVPTEIIRFEAETPGRFVLEARWVLMSPDRDEVGRPQRRRYEAPVAVDDYDAIIAVSSELLGKLAADIAASVAPALVEVKAEP
jgi:uncharacterized lipoprotein YmbA